MQLGNYQVSEDIPLPPKHDYGIGMIGCGGIVNYAHLPAYKAHGLNIVACYDVSEEAATRTAAEHGIPHVASSLDALLADPRIQIVDIAVPPWEQRAVAEQAAAAGKHMLCQKPLAFTYADAVAIVEAAQVAGVKLAVNQQMRWDSGIRIARQMIEAGALGQPTDVRIGVSVLTPWDIWPWIRENNQIEIMFHSIHYIDSMRFLFGEPVRVSSCHSRYPGQVAKGETKTISVWEYDSGFHVSIDVNHQNWSEDVYATFRFLGTSGIIKGTLGLMYDYPRGRPDSLEFQTRGDQPGPWHTANIKKMWIPDAFIGPMASLMQAIQEDSDPLTSGADNLRTLQIVHASYLSAAEHRAVTPAEIVGNR